MTMPSFGAAALRSPARRAVVLGVLSVLLVASLVWLTAEVVARRDGGVASAGGSAAVSRDREAVMSTTRQFALRAFNYGPDDLQDGAMPEYSARLEELVSTNGQAKLEQFAAGIAALVKELKQETTSEVYATGVAELTDGRAQALVTGAFETTWHKGTKREQTFDPIQYRYRVDLVQVEGEWRVDDFGPVGTSAAPGEEPTQ